MDRRRLIAAGVVGGGGTRYLLRDEFTTDASAPLASPRVCEPGPGSCIITDTTNKLSIVSGDLVFSGLVGDGDPSVYGGPQTISNGLALFFDCQSGGVPNYAQGGWATGAGTVPGVYVRYRPHVLNSVFGVVVEGGFTIGKKHSFAVILRGTGGAWILSKPNGANWILHYVHDSNCSSLLYPGISYNNYVDATGRFGRMTVANLPSPFDSVNGLAVAEINSSAAGGLSTMEPDGFLEFTWTAVAGAVLNLMFRRTDDDNCWIVRLDQANSKMFLIEKNAGTETERGATGGVSQTFANGVSYRVWIKCNGNLIEVGITQNAIKITYASATFNKAAVGIKNDLAVTNLISWPRIITGLALDVINSRFP